MKGAVRNHKRDLEILFLRNVRGWTLTAIGEKYNITKGRARVLYDRIAEEKKKEEESNKQMGIGA
jgi:Sigma-70, region 4